MDDIDTNTAEALKTMNRELRKQAEFYHLTFNTDTGREVMKHMESMTSVSHLSGNDLMDVSVNVSPAEFVFLREGQCQVIRYIKTMIKFYEENR